MPQSSLAHRCLAPPGRSSKANTAAGRPAAQPTTGSARLGLAARPQRWRHLTGSSSTAAQRRLVSRAQPAADFADFVLVPWDASRETWWVVVPAVVTARARVPPLRRRRCEILLLLLLLPPSVSMSADGCLAVWPPRCFLGSPPQG